METFSALLAIYGGNSPVTGEFPRTGGSRRHRAHYDVTFVYQKTHRFDNRTF